MKKPKVENLILHIASLKGQCHENFECCFLHQLAPHGPLRGILGHFRFVPKIREDIRQKVGSAV